MPFQYGEGRHGFVVAESTYGTQVVPAATDAFRLTSFDITPAYNRVEVPEQLGTRSLQETVEGRAACTWRLSVAHRPSGTAGTAPDFGLLLKHALGTEAIVGATSVTYTPLADPSGLFLSLYDKLDDVMQGVRGAIVNQVTFNWSGDDFSTIEFSGEAKDFFGAGSNTTSGAGTTSSSVVVTDSEHFLAGGLIDVGGDTNSGAGHKISSINYTTHTLTISTTATWTTGEVVKAHTPTPTVAGTALYGTIGSLSLDAGSTTFSHLNGSISIATGITLYNRGFGSSSATDVQLSAGRRITGNLSMVLRDNNYNRIVRGQRKVAEDLKLIIGSTAGSIVTITGNEVEIDPTAIGGGAGLIEMSLPMRFKTATVTGAENEFSLAYT
uniref:Putative tail protein n=1 Tax=viral metagenome TaxID=1070528 RepID=A0A6M3J1J3_9ZZZZ